MPARLHRQTLSEQRATDLKRRSKSRRKDISIWTYNKESKTLKNAVSALQKGETDSELANTSELDSRKPYLNNNRLSREQWSPYNGVAKQTVKTEAQSRVEGRILWSYGIGNWWVSGAVRNQSGPSLTGKCSSCSVCKCCGLRQTAWACYWPSSYGYMTLASHLSLLCSISLPFRWAYQQQLFWRLN